MHAFAFEPAFALAQVETLRTVRAYMAPAAPLAVWALETIFQEITRGFFGVSSKGGQLIWRQDIVM